MHNICIVFLSVVAFCSITHKLTAQALPLGSTPQEIFQWRGLPEPLVPMGEDTPAQRVQLLASLNRFASRMVPDDFSALDTFLQDNPVSPWRMAVAANLGLFQYRNAWFSRCIDSYKTAWDLGKDTQDPRARALVDLAGGEYAKMLARLGRMEELRAFLQEVGDRTFQGPATELVSAARQGLALMEDHPEMAFRCGPLAVASILSSKGQQILAAETITLKSTIRGTSLLDVTSLANRLGLDFRVARRAPGAKMIVPSIIHWKVGHYAAVLAEDAGRYHTKDPTFENDHWPSLSCLDQEASGYFLIPAGPLPVGWTAVDDTQAAEIFGKGATSGSDQNRTGPDDHKVKACQNSFGMATYNFHTLLVSLNIEDTPVGYQPPFGHPVFFTATYNQREAGQPGIFTYSNIGPKWTHNWLSYVSDNPTVPDSASIAVAGGGTYLFSGYNATTAEFAPQQQSQTLLRRRSSSPIRYELEYPNGAIDVFAASDGSTSSLRKVFLVERRDAFGNTTSLTYDSQLRLTAITDAAGQKTSLDYEETDPYLITRVTDPFGRSAILTYEASKLVKMRDVAGLESQFAYAAGTDFIKSLTTPYGKTIFSTYEFRRTRRITAADPQNDMEVLEFNEDTGIVAGSDPPDMIPIGMFVRNNVLYARNSYYWDKKAWAEAPGDYSAARLYHWLHGLNYTQASGTLESEKPPRGARIWYNYPGQEKSDEGATLVGSMDKPTKVGRKLADGSTQLQQYEYNPLGQVISATDPMGRTTLFTYEANQIDLRTVSQQGGGTLATYTYESSHLPKTHTDAAGQTTIYKYNTRGQITSFTNPKNEKVDLTYYDANTPGRQRLGRLASIDGPLAGTADASTLDYDAFGRVSTVKRPDGFFVALNYDTLDRITRVAYPDGTAEETTYDRLHQSSTTDRLGRITRYVFNNLGQLATMTGPDERKVRYDWCRCGDLKALIDPMGRATFWKHDVQGRVSYKQYPDGSRETYAYDPAASRLISITDAKGQVKKLSYNIDNTISKISYENARQPTPDVSFTYDTIYSRLLNMTDGLGLTTYTYHPIAAGTLGAGGLASVDGPWANDVISYGYDELGRISQRSLSGVNESVEFDSLGRPHKLTNQLGGFSAAYEGSSSRLRTVIHSGGLKTEFGYWPATKDFRLASLRHLQPNGVTSVSLFEYDYDAAGRIRRWKHEVEGNPATATSWSFGYDNSDQLTSAKQTQGASLLKSYLWEYDPAGNRLTEALNGTTTNSVYNTLNEISFTTATLPSLNYEWDANNRLTAINNGAQRTEFTYDGLGRRVRVIEKMNEFEVSNHCYLWDGLAIRERRDASGEVPQQRYLAGGYADLTSPSPQRYLQTTDHLGSIRETTDTQGNLVQRIDYDLWGLPTFSTPISTSPFGFTGHFWHETSGLHLAPYRAYDPRTGRWISRDPIGEAGGMNLFSYALNRPQSLVDPTGLAPTPTATPAYSLETTSFAQSVPNDQPFDFVPMVTPIPTPPPFVGNNPGIIDYLAQIITWGDGPCCGPGYDCSNINNPRRNHLSPQNIACIEHDESLTRCGISAYSSSAYQIHENLSLSSPYLGMHILFGSMSRILAPYEPSVVYPSNQPQPISRPVPTQTFSIQ